jgi:uncharacterized protein (UPF0548 family)
MSEFVIIDAAVLVGVALVLPFATVVGWWWWVATAAVGVSMTLPVGLLSAVIAGAWVVASLISLRRLALAAGPFRGWSAESVCRLLGAGYAVVAGAAFVASRGGLRLFGIGEPVVELTSVHFTYAGAAALALAADASAGATGRARLWGTAAVMLTAGGPPIVALGFVSGLAAAQVGGAVVMALGVVTTGALELIAASNRRMRPAPRVLLGISGLSIWIPMGLAVAWAAGQHWNVPALSIPDMARTHGAANGAGFILCGLWGRGLARRNIDEAAARIVEAGAGDEPTYDHVRSTIDQVRWPDRHPFVRSRVVGHGPADFAAAVEGLREWVCHRGIRARVHPADAPIAVGATVAVELPLGPVRIVVPNRIVAVLDEPARFGFAYGTLPGHEERGEEGFVVELTADGAVTATVAVDAVPASRAARLAGPAVTLVQHIAVGRYLAAWAAYVETAASTQGPGPV